MKVLIKAASLFLIVTHLSSVTVAAQPAKAKFDKGQPECTILHPNGQIIIGDKQDNLCSFYKNVKNVEVIYHQDFYNSLEQNVLCELEDGESMHIKKFTYRADRFEVHAFGHIYIGGSNSYIDIIPDQTTVSSSNVGDLEPVRITFNSNKNSALNNDGPNWPQTVTVYLQGGRAPLTKAIDCQFVN